MNMASFECSKIPIPSFDVNLYCTSHMWSPVADDIVPDNTCTSVELDDIQVNASPRGIISTNAVTIGTDTLMVWCWVIVLQQLSVFSNVYATNAEWNV